MAKSWPLLALVVGLVAACAGSQVGRPAQLPSPQASASPEAVPLSPSPIPEASGPPAEIPKDVVFVTLEGGGPDFTLNFRNSTGAFIGSSVVYNSGTLVGIGSKGAYVLEHDYRLARYSPGGEHVVLDSFPDRTDVQGLAEAPDGSRFMYSLVTWTSTGDMATSKLYVQSPGASSKLVATLTRPAQVNRRWGGGYPVLRWDQGGVLLGTGPTNVGGYAPFIDEGYGLASVVRMNPDSGALSQPLNPDDCRFGDVSSKGDVACIAADDRTVKVIHTDGSIARFTGDEPFSGRVAFLERGQALTFMTTADGEPATGWRYSLWTVGLDGRSVPKRVLTSINRRIQDGNWAFNALAGSRTVAVLTGAEDATQLTLVTPATGGRSALGTAAQFAGVMSGSTSG